MTNPTMLDDEISDDDLDAIVGGKGCSKPSHGSAHTDCVALNLVSDTGNAIGNSISGLLGKGGLSADEAAVNDFKNVGNDIANIGSDIGNAIGSIFS